MDGSFQSDCEEGIFLDGDCNGVVLDGALATAMDPWWVSWTDPSRANLKASWTSHWRVVSWMAPCTATAFFLIACTTKKETSQQSTTNPTERETYLFLHQDIETIDLHSIDRSKSNKQQQTNADHKQQMVCELQRLALPRVGMPDDGSCPTDGTFSVSEKNI